MLRIKFIQVENVLCAKILEQDVGESRRTSENTLFTASNGFELRTYGYPEMCLDTNCLYLRGFREEYDHLVFSSEGESIEKVSKYIQNALLAIKEYNEIMSKEKSSDDFVKIEYFTAE